MTAPSEFTVTGSPVTSSGTLGLSYTGTQTAGGIVYGDGTGRVITGAGTTGQFLTSGGSGIPTWTSGYIVLKVSGSDFTTTSVSQSTITGLSVAVSAASVYRYNCSILMTGTGTGGTQLTVTMGSVTSIAWHDIHRIAGTQTVTEGGSSGVLSGSCTSGCPTFLAEASINGTLVTNSSGTLAIGAANSTAGQTTTVKVGSNCFVWGPL